MELSLITELKGYLMGCKFHLTKLMRITSNIWRGWLKAIHPCPQMIEDTDKRLAVHEALCSERYRRIDESLCRGDKRMAKIEYLIYAVMLCVLLGPGVAAEFVNKFLGV